MWRQVRGERGRERGREEFDEEMLSDDDFLDFALAWWPPLDAPTVLSLAARPGVPGPGGRGRADAARSSACSPSRGHARHRGLSVEDMPLLDELRYALGDVPHAPTTSATTRWR